MSLPGSGTVVRYHANSSYSYPAIVAISHDEWNSQVGTDWMADPGSGKVALVYFDLGGGVGLNASVAEGTGVGQYSLLATEAE